MAIIQLCVLPFCPESPRYLLIIAGKEDEAVHGTYVFITNFLVFLDLRFTNLSVFFPLSAHDTTLLMNIVFQFINILSLLISLMQGYHAS